MSSFVTTRQRSCGKAMFSVMSVCSQEIPCGHYPSCLGPHHRGPPFSGCSSPSPPVYRDLMPPPSSAPPQACCLLKLVHLRAPLCDDIWRLATEACTVGELPVCILLECFLVSLKITTSLITYWHFYPKIMYWIKKHISLSVTYTVHLTAMFMLSREKVFSQKLKW